MIKKPTAPLKSIRDMSSLSRIEFEQTCISFADHAYMGNHIQLCKVLSKYKMYVDTRDVGIAPHLILDGFWESWITRFIVGIVNPGYVCLDIGANFGYYALLLAELGGREGKTIAIEPNPVICDILRANSIVNEWGFDVKEGAASDRKGETILSVEDKFFGGGTIMPLDENLPGRSRFIVQTFTVDEIMNEKQLEKVDFIKLDSEGFEPYIFEGMQHTISNSPGLKIVMEYSAYMYPDPEKFTRRLFSDFEIGIINGQSLLEKLSQNDIGSLVKHKRPVDLFLRSKL